MKDIDTKNGQLDLKDSGSPFGEWEQIPIPKGQSFELPPQTNALDRQSMLYDAFARAQAAFEPIHRNRTVQVYPKKRQDGYQPPPYTFKYAELSEIQAKTRPALNAEGFALTECIRRSTDTRAEFIVARLVHRYGVIECDAEVFYETRAGQSYNSALTYAKRAAVSMLLGVAADDDDDGNFAEGNSAEFKDSPLKPTPKTQAREAIAKAVEKTSFNAPAPAENFDAPPLAGDTKELDESQEKHAEGLLVDALEEMKEACHEGRAAGIRQIWAELKYDYVKLRLWNTMKDKAPDLFRVMRDTLRPPQTIKRGPASASARA